MGVLLDSCRGQRDVLYTLAGIAADVCQLARAYKRGEKKGVRRNIAQIVRKLEKIKSSL